MAPRTRGVPAQPSFDSAPVMARLEYQGTGGARGSSRAAQPMNYDLERSDLATVLAEARLVAEAAGRTFGQLSAAQIN